MEIEYIDKDSLEVYGPLLPQEVANALETGEDIPALGLSIDGMGCGAVALNVEDHVLEIVSLYVDPAYRRRGGGRLLLETAMEAAADSCPETWVGFDSAGEAAETAPAFLEALGFHRERSQEDIRVVTLAKLTENPFFAGHEGKGSVTVPLSQVPETELERVYKACVVDGVAYMERREFLNELDRDLSMAVLNKGQIVSFVAMKPVDTDLVELSWAKSSDSRHLPVLLRAVYAACMEKLGPEGRICVQPVTDSGLELVEKLMPEAEELTQNWVRPLG